MQAIEVYKISNWLSPTQMMNELDTMYHTKSSSQVDVDIFGNITDFTKNPITDVTK